MEPNNVGQQAATYLQVQVMGVFTVVYHVSDELEIYRCDTVIPVKKYKRLFW